jgi:hypothetical protein
MVFRRACLNIKQREGFTVRVIGPASASERTHGILPTHRGEQSPMLTFCSDTRIQLADVYRRHAARVKALSVQDNDNPVKRSTDRLH